MPPGGLPGRCGVKFPALLLVYTPWVRSSGLMPTASECALLVDASLVHRFPPVWVVTSCRTANAGAAVATGRMELPQVLHLVLIYPPGVSNGT